MSVFMLGNSANNLIPIVVYYNILYKERTKKS
jgi:hypothetical protein